MFKIRYFILEGSDGEGSGAQPGGIHSQDAVKRSHIRAR